MARHHRRALAVPSVSNRQRGFALLIVLWTVGFIALLGTRIVAEGRSDTQLADNLRQEAVLAAAADGAVANVVFQMQAARDPAFQADGVVREVRIGHTPTSSGMLNRPIVSVVIMPTVMWSDGSSPTFSASCIMPRGT